VPDGAEHVQGAGDLQNLPRPGAGGGQVSPQRCQRDRFPDPAPSAGMIVAQMLDRVRSLVVRNCSASAS
jgi:hypothetical protein